MDKKIIGYEIVRVIEGKTRVEEYSSWHQAEAALESLNGVRVRGYTSLKGGYAFIRPKMGEMTQQEITSRSQREAETLHLFGQLRSK